MDWNPDSISQDQLHDFRRAAEAAWGDDTRHESQIGHPDPSRGQCYVTSRWLTTHLGGNVGVKNGHYVWVSPDRSHVIDLTGDQFSYSPADLRFNGIQLDEEDEPWEFDEEHKRYRPGPIMFKRADHPLYKGLRVKTFKTENPRVKLFAERANQALNGNLPANTASHGAFLRKADFGWGGDAFPGQEPQAQERIDHDRPEDVDGPQHYKWVFTNGRLEVSPHDDYDYLAQLAGDATGKAGPTALGEVVVSDGTASWRGTGNLGVSLLTRALQDHTRQVGWQWGGLTDLSDSQKLAHVMGYIVYDGRLLVADNYDPTTDWGRIEIIGKTAHVEVEDKLAAEALQEWADDFGYHLALNTTIKTPEDIDGYDTYGPRPDYAQGPTDTTPPGGTLRCPECGQVFPSFGLYVLHRKEEEPQGDELDREDGHFPEMDMDKVLPPHFKDREPRIFPLAHNAPKLDKHMDKSWRFSSAARMDLGAFQDGDLVGMLTVTSKGHILDATVRRAPEATFAALVRNAARRFEELTYDGSDNAILARLRRMGFVDQPDGPYVKWAKGKEPADMISQPVPFIYDVDKDQLHIGQPGQNEHALIGQFTPGGIVQGFYEPGGTVTVTGQTDYPWTVRHLVDLWYWTQPHMRVTDVQYEDPMGNKQKLAAASIGQHVRQTAAMDPAVWRAYQALEDAGGEVYAVGGVVRDAMMGIPSNDVDLMVRGLHPDQVSHILKALPGKLDITGKSFGVFRYNYRGHEVEVALPRTERSTGDRRVDFDVNVDHTLPIEQDLLRRDFTINSPAVNLKTGEVVDPYGAADDIKNGVLRTVHPSSFVEDPTRLLRALVMNGRYGVQPDERTRAEMEKYGPAIHNESWDNMQKIMDKLLKSDNPARAFRLAQETGLLKHILPELSSSWDYDSRNPHHAYPLGTHHMHVLEGVQEQTTDPDLRLAAALHDVGKPASRAMKCNDCGNVWDEKDHPDDPFICPKCGSTNTKGTFHGGDGVGQDHAPVGAAMAHDRLTHMRWPVSRKKRIVEIIKHHMFPAFGTPKGARKFLNRVGDHADDLLMLRHADMFGKGTDEYQNTKTPVDDMRGLVEQARTSQAPTALSGLAVNGNDLIAMGMQPGPQIGQTLNTLLQAVVENPELNNREQLLALAQQGV